LALFGVTGLIIACTAPLMSFNDLTSNRSPADLESGNGRSASTPSDSAFLNLQSSLSIQVFKINSNVQGIMKAVDQLGTGRDNGQTRKNL
jgi:hypothetical protein